MKLVILLFALLAVVAMVSAIPLQGKKGETHAMARSHVHAKESHAHAKESHAHVKKSHVHAKESHVHAKESHQKAHKAKALVHKDHAPKAHKGKGIKANGHKDH